MPSQRLCVHSRPRQLGALAGCAQAVPYMAITSVQTILINGNAQRSSGAPFYHRRSLFLCGCCTRLEQFAFRHYFGHVTVGFQTGVEDRAVLSQLTCVSAL